MPSSTSHKGENGKLLIIAGSSQYHGAAVLTVLAARRFVDLIYFYPGERDSHLVHSIKQIPEVIVEHNLSRLSEVDAVLFGSGLGDSSIPCDSILKKSKKLIVDGDGFRHIKGKIPKGAILTPHEGEFRRLFACSGTKEYVTKMARKYSCVILKKGHKDIISNGKTTVLNKGGNPGMTKGGTGDVLAGLTAALACKNECFIAAATASHINSYAGDMLKKKMGYNFCATDLVEQLPFAYFKLKKK